MKKTIIGLMLATITSFTFAQKDSVYVSKIVDDMEDKSYYVPSRKMICASDDKKTGFALSAFLTYKNDEITINELKVKTVNIGSCDEKDELIILFEDDSKIKLISWNDFNCKGDAWFSLSKSDKESLSNLKIKKIKVQNGRTFESFTKELTEDSDYFIQLFYATNNKKIKELKEK
ncbi:MAG: hypothetical protein IPJ01_11355 [Micavibrio sp.]|nr:hypothetical protein [Micavibrio sp.]